MNEEQKPQLKLVEMKPRAPEKAKKVTLKPAELTLREFAQTEIENVPDDIEPVTAVLIVGTTRSGQLVYQHNTGQWEANFLADRFKHELMTRSEK